MVVIKQLLACKLYAFITPISKNKSENGLVKYKVHLSMKTITPILMLDSYMILNFLLRSGIS